MAELPSESLMGKENFSSVKEWLFSKLQIPYNDNDGKVSDTIEGESDTTQSGRLPRIVISRGSMKSINSPLGTPTFRPVSPLVKTFSDNTGASKQKTLKLRDSISVDGVPHGAWRSPIPNRKTGRGKPSSEPTTPFDAKSFSRPPSLAPNPGSINLLSPVFRFSIRDNLSSCSSSPMSTRSTTSFSSVDKDPTRCYSTKSIQSRKSKPDRDLHYECTTKNIPEAATRLGQSDAVPNRALALRRTSSCGPHLNRHSPKQKEPLTKAVSQTDVNNTIKKTHSGKMKRNRRAGSREKTRSAISLTRSISINLDFFRGRRSSKSKSDRKLSLANNDELQRVYERRRSSLMRLLCQGQNTDSRDKSDDSSSASSIKNTCIAEYSPKVTRPLFIGSLKKLGTHFDDFRSTFESDTRENPSVFGQVKIMFQYMTEKRQLEVTLLRGCNLAARTEGTLGIYAKICLLPGKKQKQRSESRHDTHDPTFHDLFCFRFSLDKILESHLRLKFFDKPGIFSVSVPIGECEVKLYNYDLTAVTVVWLNLKEPGYKKMRNGTDFLDISFEEGVNVPPAKKGIKKLFSTCSRS